MYGMIHRAIHDLVTEQHDPEDWEISRMSLRIGPELMISTAVYPDEKTIELIHRAATLMSLTPEEFLQRLGRFWITFSEKGSFSHMLDFTGKDLPSFIGNLDRMHRAVVLAMPKADVPLFKLVESRPGELIVDYLSTRTGLEPFVTGLLEGLLGRFGHTGSVNHVEGSAQPSRFIVRYI